MAAISYTAKSRAPLVTDSPAHTAGSSYSFDVKLRAYSTIIDTPKRQHIAMNGRVETVLYRSSDIYNIVLIFPNTLLADMREFLYSVAAGESFVFDAFGTVASADDPQNMVMMGNSVPQIVMSHGETPWRSVSFQARVEVV